MERSPIQLYRLGAVGPGCFCSNMMAAAFVPLEVDFGSIFLLGAPYIIFAVIVLAISRFNPNETWIHRNSSYTWRYWLAVIFVACSVLLYLAAGSFSRYLAGPIDSKSGSGGLIVLLFIWLSGFLLGLAPIYAVTGYWIQAEIYREPDEMDKDFA